MSNGTGRRRLELTGPEKSHPVVGVWLAALAECRERTLELVDGIDAASIDVDHPLTSNSIGTLLYHIAAIEADWLYVDVLGESRFPPDVVELLPHDVREGSPRLTPVRGVALDTHLERLAGIRRRLVATFAPMSLERFQEMRALDHYDVSPAWVAYHLLEHEAGHCAEMSMILDPTRG